MSGEQELNPPLVDLQTDSHVHTSLCNHASGSMEEYIQAAVHKGLKTIIFLEHMEAEIDYDERTWLTETDFSHYFEQGELLREKYQDMITVQLGVELGYNPRATDVLQKRLAAYEWDLIGLSYHFFHDGSNHLNMVSRRQRNIDALIAYGPDKILTAYFNGLMEAVEIFDCRVLCHLDAVLRHYPGLQFKESHEKQIEHLLDLMKRKNMLLEVNTSGFTLRGEPYPTRRILARAIQMGIPLTAGSDAHRPDQVGRHFDLLPDFLAALREPVHSDSADNVKPTA